MNPMNGAELIAKERQEQIKKHGHGLERDSRYINGELLTSAIAFLERDISKYPDYWDEDVFANVCNKSDIDRLAIAGAMVAAEIDRLLAAESEVSNG